MVGLARPAPGSRLILTAERLGIGLRRSPLHVQQLEAAPGSCRRVHPNLRCLAPCDRRRVAQPCWAPDRSAQEAGAGNTDRGLAGTLANRRRGSERPTPKHSPNFSPTLTPPLTWAGSTRTGAGCPRPGTSTTRVAPGQVFPPSAMARSTAASRSGRAGLPNPHRPRIGRSGVGSRDPNLREGRRSAGACRPCAWHPVRTLCMRATGPVRGRSVGRWHLESDAPPKTARRLSSSR